MSRTEPSTIPQRQISQLTDDLPFVLFPVRIETHFHTEGTSHELWVRIYPDEITTFTHEKDLTADEITAGESYWRNVWATRTETDDAGATVRTTLWNGLAKRFGANRAAWVARQTQPTNWSKDWRTLAELLLREQAPPKSQVWTQAPHTRLMPDQFVVTTYSAGQKIYEVIGKPIPDTLVLGPDPLKSDGAFGRDGENKLVINPEMAWMFDFDQALAVGMAVKLTLDAPWFQHGFDRLVVLGVRFSTDARQNQTLLEDLIQNHNYSAEGLSLIPQGTPTNNTDKASSGYSSTTLADRQREVEENKAYFSPVTDYYQQQDGQRLAEALGVSTDSLFFVQNADSADVAEALAMNNALWPATWGLFLDDVLTPLVSRPNQALARQFFTEFVTGRGPLPALRAGDQPYGLLVTSNLKNWQFTPAELGANSDFWTKLLSILQQLRTQWEQLLPQVAFAGKPGDPFQILMNIIGLQASSVTYSSRKAVTDMYAWNYLNFQDTALLTELNWVRIHRVKQQQLSRLGFDTNSDFLLEKLIFQSRTDTLDGPVIDADPTLPLSETDPIQPFNGADNYIDWLLKSPLDTIKNQAFLDQNNQPTAIPKARLYQLLRRAYLEEFGQSITSWLVSQQVISDFPTELSIQNVDGKTDLTKADYLQLDASALRLTSTKMSVADFIKTLFPKSGETYSGPREMLPLMGLVKALQQLHKLPTARLERLFAEHIDLCSYRLDAWQTGLVARRLYNLHHDANHNYLNKGTYLGAYGWVENLKPNSAKTAFSQEQYPEPLQDPNTKTIYEDTTNGGYIQTPSLSHAVTAAVLRNAYLSHGTDNTQLAVNLSSERVRLALTYLDGLKNGQELGALLGYQFERGLHDRSLFLNESIYVLRDRFPLISKKLTPVPDGTAQEVIEARNVINGYDLLDYARTHPQLQGIAGLPADGSPEKTALLAELDRLTDALDGLADLSLSESVFQAVQGNYDRAGGMMQAISEGKLPPDPDIVNTPRSGTSITHRVAICLKTSGVGDRHTAWGATASPRSKANPYVNEWLGERLPKPDMIQFKYVSGTVEDTLSLAQFDIQPLDFVLMTGSDLGALSSELERWLAIHIRYNFAISDGAQLALDFHASAPNATSLAALLPYLRALKTIVTEARPLNALDFLLPAQSYLEGEPNPSGYQNIGAQKADFEAAMADIQAKLELLKSATDTLKSATGTARAAGQNTVVSAALTAVRTALTTIAAYGWIEALPASTDANSVLVADELISQATGVLLFVQKQLGTTLFDGFDELAIDQQVERCRDAARQIYGRSFNWVPTFQSHNQPQLTDALAHSSDMLSGPPELVMENWLQSTARVRTGIETLETIAFHHDLYQDDPFALTPVQLPYVAGEQWVGETFMETQRRQERLSLTLHQPSTSPQAGWLLDEWTELIPTDKETTGITFQYNRPDAMPPQAILIAVAPVLNGHWNWLELIGIINDTLDQAKLRAVEPDMLTNTDYFQALPAVLNDFSTGGFSTVFTQGSTLMQS